MRTSGGSSVAEQIWKRVEELLGDGRSAKLAFEAVAKERRTTVGNVQQQYYRWRRQANKGARKVVRHGRGAARGAAGASRRAATGAATAVSGPLGMSVDFQAVIKRLERLANSRTEQVALDACKTLLSLSR